MVIVGCDARPVDTRLQGSMVHKTCAIMGGSGDKDKDKKKERTEASEGQDARLRDSRGLLQRQRLVRLTASRKPQVPGRAGP